MYRRLDDGADAAESIGSQLRDAPGVTVLDVKPRSILVEVDASQSLPEFRGWQEFEVKRYPVPDARPKLRK